ncbi:MAG TPA: tetratricopeptide repeat protein [Vicinamibacterales bacterium]|nr:tetratricopeptide repeat protein [Vicinamibacterales bacterium]
MSRRRDRARAAIVAVAVLAATAAGPADVPPLPDLPLDSFPADVREQVAQALRRAREQPASAAAAGELAMLLHALEQFATAERAYARAQALDPRDARWAYGLGICRMALGRQAEAVAALREAVRIDPAALGPRVKLGEALLAAGELDEAARLYERLAADAPDLPHAHYGLGRVRAARGDAAGAVAHYVAALERFEAYGAARYALALAYRNLGEAAKAQAELARYETHRLRAPPLPDPFLERIEALARPAARHLREGVALAEAGRLEEARAAFERAAAADPSSAQAHLNLLILHAKRGDAAAAERHYRAAVALQPGLADAHYNYGVLLAGLGRTDEAAETFRRALDSNPYHAGAHNNLGLLLERRGQLVEAAEHYRRAVENDPQNRQARFNLGRALVALARPREAIPHFAAIVEPEDADTPRYLYALAAAYIRAGEIETGRRHAREALERAERLGQRELAAAIRRDLTQLKPE